MKTVPFQLLESLAESAPVGPEKHQPNRTHGEMDLQSWIDDHHVDVEGPTAWNGGRRWIFRVCPWNPEHRNGSAYIVQLPDGAIAAGCHHNGCKEHDWRSLRDLVEPRWRLDKHRNANPDIRRGGAQGGWEPVIPFHQFDLPAFPSDALPDWLRDFVEAEASATQTPFDLPGMLSLSVVAASCAKKVVVRMKEGHMEPLNIFTVTALPPGNRKSAVFTDTARPLEQYEESEARRAAQEIAKMQSGAKIKEAELKRLEQQAASAKLQERQKLTEAALQLATEVAQMSIPSSPRYIVDDCTPEKLATILRDQGGRIAVMSPEGDVFDLMAGRYSAGVGNFGVYLKGHSGDTLRVDRVGRAPEFVKGPALTVGLTVQPEVIRGLIEKPGFRGRGLLGRFLYALPKSLLGHRHTNPPPVPDEVRTAYHSNVLALLQLPFGTDDKGGPAPHILSLDPDARACIQSFEAWLEPQLGEFGELGSVTDWAGKLVGAVGRIAGILHMASLAGDEAPWEIHIPGDTIEHAIRLGKYWIPHAKAAFAEMGADPVQDQAKRILRWIEHMQLDGFTKRDLHQGLKGTFKRAEELDAPLALLEAHWFIRKQTDAEQGGPGRRRSPTYEVNPGWASQNSHNPQNRGAGGNSEDCENCEDRDAGLESG